MRIISNLAEMTETARGWLAGGAVGFVPLSSQLHDGHLALIQAARSACEISVVGLIDRSLLIETRPQATQDEQTRDRARELRLLEGANVDIVFLPRREDMYPATFSMYVMPTGHLAQSLARSAGRQYGRRFVTTIVKLLQLVRPDSVFFGQKDIQQVAIIRQLVQDLNIDVSLHMLPTVREESGLAVGSRNRQLTSEERQEAAMIYRALLRGKVLFEQGERRAEAIATAVVEMLASAPHVKLDYLTICDADSLVEVSEVKSGTLLAIGARVGEVYLNDNVLF